ncbi:MAG: CBS domain-containing protein [Paracoccaceae bacterium]|nr:CBS domain-containing protein [Paracoccaceae bacterium]
MKIKSLCEIIDGRTVCSIEAKETVQFACCMMHQENIGALVVMENETLVGILSERDVVRRCVVQHLDPENTLVSQVMTSDPFHVRPSTPPSEALSCMLDGGFRHLPIVDESVVVGMISMRDIPAAAA